MRGNIAAAGSFLVAKSTARVMVRGRNSGFEPPIQGKIENSKSQGLDVWKNQHRTKEERPVLIDMTGRVGR